MVNRVRGVWLNLTQSLGFLPGLIVAAFTVLGFVLVEVDGQIDLEGTVIVFQGDGSAARTVLSVIAGSLITVAGLTFSITMVVLQLASSQFSPRVLRTFFGDRITQITIGTYVGTFVYALLVLRAVGSFGDAGFVPRLSVTIASLLGIGAVILLIVFLNHVSQMVQVSHVTSNIARDTLKRIDLLYPERYGEPAADQDAERLLREWRAVTPGVVRPDRAGYVQRVGLDDLVGGLEGQIERMVILVCAGDFASSERPIAHVWPPEAAEECGEAIRSSVTIASERDLSQDIDFGVRQLADTALKAMSPGINDPMTAVTCISYLRSIFARLSERSSPPRVRRFADGDLTVILRRRSFDEQVDALRQIGRYTGADAWVAGNLLEALAACAAAARRSGAHARVAALREVGRGVADQARSELVTDQDRAAIDRLAAGLEALA